MEWASGRIPSTGWIQGNHDWAVGWDEDPKWAPSYRHLAEVTRRRSLQVLTQGRHNFLCELSPMRSLVKGGAACVACHAVPSEPRFQYLRMNDHLEIWRTEVELARHPDFLFVGHTHFQGEMRVGKTTIVNPGSVGQPKDGDPRAAYAIWEDGKVTLRRASYDVEETVRAYERTPLAARDVSILASVLRSGGNMGELALAPRQ